MKSKFKIYRGDPQISQAIREHGGIKKIALKMGMPPGTLANKTNGWSVFTEAEVERLLLIFSQESQTSSQSTETK